MFKNKDQGFVQIFCNYFIMFIALFAVIIYANSDKIAYRMDYRTYGNLGRLEIPTLGINVAVSDTEFGDQQSLVDAEDSAAYLHWYSQDAIADHRSQEFSNLPSAVPGKTVAYLLNENGAKSYVCVYKGDATVTYKDGHKSSIVDDEGRSALSANEGGICMYTCNGQLEGSELNVTITYWQPIKVNLFHYFTQVI